MLAPPTVKLLLNLFLAESFGKLDNTKPNPGIIILPIPLRAILPKLNPLSFIEVAKFLIEPIP